MRVTAGNGSIILTPVNPRRMDQGELERHLDRIVGERGRILKELADS